MQTEKLRVRQKRLRIQQGVISVVCLALIVFVITWLINTAVTGRTNGLPQIKKAAKPAVVRTTGNSAADSSSQADNAFSTSAAAVPASSSSEDTSSEEAKEYDGAAMKDDFSDACFIGDSRTVGLEMNSDKAKADFYASQGLSIGTVMTDQVVTLENGNPGTVVEGAAQKPYKRIFIMFGINELGWPYPENFVSGYEELVNAVREVQPDARIYIQSILPVSPSAAAADPVFTNENIDAFNGYVKQVAEETGTTYLDINPYFKDDSGALPDDAAADGIHFVRDYCLEWIDILAYLAPTEE